MSSQYIYTMNRVSKVVPPKRQIIKDISLSFFPGAKIGLLGLNGAGKSTVLKIMAGVDTDFEGEARPQPGIKVGYLEQEPRLNPEQTVREAVEEGVGEVLQAQAALDAVYAAYAEEGADFDALAKEQERLEAILAAASVDEPGGALTADLLGRRRHGCLALGRGRMARQQDRPARPGQRTAAEDLGAALGIEAGPLGDLLVVAVNDDDSTRRLKGPGRPLNLAADRAGVVAELATDPRRA